MALLEQTAKQRENALRAAQGLPVISAGLLDSTPTPLQTTQISEQIPPVFDFQPAQLTEPEKQVSAAQKRIQQLKEATQGSSDMRKRLETERGVEEKTQAVTDLESKMKTLTAEAQAIPLQLQEEAQGRGITKGGLAPLETARLRTNAIQSLTTQAQLEGARGNLTTALDLIDRAVETEFAPKKEELDVAVANLNMLLQSPELSLADKNRANRMLAQKEQEQAKIEIQQEIEKARKEAIMNAIQFGADTQTIHEMEEADSPEEALKIAVGKGFIDRSYLLNQKIKEIDLKQKQAQLDVYRRYGGLTPSQYLSQIEKQQKEIKAAEQTDKEAQQAEQQALEDAIILDTSMNQIDAILDSSSLDTVVGGTFLTRGIQRQKPGFLGKTVGLFTGLGGIRGAYDEISGNADDTVALTQQILDQQFLDKLISVKSKGATFGALSDNEGQALRNAANAIANTAIKDSSDRVIGYDMSEKTFKNQMEQIKYMMDLARQRATGQTFSSDERNLLDSVYDTDFNPEF